MSNTPVSPEHRRSFLERMAAGALAVAAVPAVARAAPSPAPSPSPAAAAAGEPWLAGLASTKHKQVFDATTHNGGFPMMFAGNYMKTMREAYSLGPKDVRAVIVIRHFSAPLGLSDAIWAKYQVGAMIGLTDPATKAPAVRNIYVNSREGDMMNPAQSLEKMIAAGAIVVVCNMALTVLSGMAGKGIGVKPDDALAEWTAGLIPGVHIAASGVLAVGRAQEAGCAYCYAG